jgi:histidine ammonia-lyase/phenylalanine ammonia-lyase
MTMFVAPSKISLDGSSLTIEDTVSVARVPDSRIEISPQAHIDMRASVALKDNLVAQGHAIYGVTTGFGDSVIRQIEPLKAAELQRNLIRYHVNGTGPMATSQVVRATMLIRANCLAKGNSGVRPEVVTRLLEYLHDDILPMIPERGSVGASGDLVPLCHLAVTLIGEGQATHGAGQPRPVSEILDELGVEPLELEPKEGLALINGTAFSTAYAVLAVADAARLAELAELCTAMACEAILGNRGHFADFIHGAKPHPGQVASARALTDMLSDSSHALDHSQVIRQAGEMTADGYVELARSIQDRYSIRCAPHVIGVLHDTLRWVRDWVEVELNSSNDNPLFDVAAGEVHSGGNFYGGHIAHAMDALKATVASLADLLDRQLELVVDEKFNRGLTPNLIQPFKHDEWRAGLHHGFKGMQLACSAITAEALSSSMPASVFSRSTEAHNQDKVSMSAMAARAARTVIELTEEVTAIHLLALCQALDLRGVDGCSSATKTAYLLIRDHAPTVTDDRAMYDDIQAVLALIRSNAFAGMSRRP